MTISILWFGGGSFALMAQEYETDRVFIRQQMRTRCLSQIRIRIEEIKKRREMTAEHELYLNWYVRNRDKAGLRLGDKQQRRLNRMLQGKSRKGLLNSRDLWKKRKQEFAAMRQRCKLAAAK